RAVASRPGGIDHVVNLAASAPLIDAGLGDWDKAIAAAHRQIDLNRSDAPEGATAKVVLTEIYALKGDRDAAIALLPELLETPGGLTPALLEHHPVWDAIREDPRFIALTKQPLREYRGAASR